MNETFYKGLIIVLVILIVLAFFYLIKVNIENVKQHFSIQEENAPSKKKI